MLRGACVREEAGARNRVFFRVKWLQPAMKGTSCVRQVRFGSFRGQSVPPLCSATSGCKSHCNGCLHGCVRGAVKCIVMAAGILHGTCVGEEAGARNRMFYRFTEMSRAKLCSTKILSRGFSCVKCKCICVSSFCVLTVRGFLHAEQLR